MTRSHLFSTFWFWLLLITFALNHPGEGMTNDLLLFGIVYFVGEGLWVWLTGLARRRKDD